jgi:multidrug efflux system outer membrane protein
MMNALTAWQAKAPAPQACGFESKVGQTLSSVKLALALLLLGLSACTVGPNYKRPDVPLPPQFHAAAQPESAASIADTKWVDLFDDATLKQLVATAIDRNFDLRIAAERVEEARASLGIARANQYPFLDAQALGQSTRSSTVGSFPVSPGEQIASTYTQAGVALSWELDFWGRMRRLTEAARAQYLATEEGRRAALVSLVSQVMTTYFELLEQDLELEIGRKTRDIANDNLRLVGLRHDRGAATGLDVSQAQQLLYTATSSIAAAERGGMPLDRFPLPPQLPAGLPSALLERRPDILQAEQNLVAANAQIGAARALYFPTIELTGFLGAQSRALTQFFTFPARMENIGPSALLPIFHAGQTRQQVRLTQAQQREMVATYQKAVYSALRDVSDALIAHDRTREQREQQEQLVHALSESVRLSTLRYQGGLDSYLQVLDAQRSLFQGQLQLSQLRMLELQSVAQLYRALGGGWQ